MQRHTHLRAERNVEPIRKPGQTRFPDRLLSARRFRYLHSLWTLLWVGGSVLGAGGRSTARADVTTEVLRLTAGARARVVWSEQAGGDRADVSGHGAEMRLMGLDTAERRGARPLLAARGSYFKPLITPRGDRVVFTDWPTRTIYAIQWNGASLLTLGTGVAVTVWQDPASGREWVGLLDALDDDGHGRPLRRLWLDYPSVREVVWDATPVTVDTVQASRDGRYLGALFPWPRAGIADLHTREVRILGRGCWPALAPDDSGLMWVFDGPHRNVVLHTFDGQSQWTVPINNLPETGDTEVYHPRWANHPRFLCVTGPYTTGDGDNRIRAGGRNVEVYVGRFNRTLTAVEQWVRLTHNDSADCFPDVWVDPVGGAPSVSVGRQSPTPVAPAPAMRIVVDAHVLETTPVPTPASIAPYRDALAVHRYAIRSVIAGATTASVVRVAQWVIRDGRMVGADPKRGGVRRLVLEPFDRHPELEGERVISGVQRRETPLYYAVTEE